jgi:3-isopropylmalate/(R)-2-methylmalate dehydratase small subunit
MLFEARIWKFGDNINTDLMMPGGEVLTRPHLTDKEAAQYCMSATRPGWASQVKKGDIIVAGQNWGCGSSRPAARMFKALGVGVIVANSMSRLFFRNAINIGMPVFICEGVSEAFEEGDLARVNLEMGEIANLSKGITLKGEALPPDSPPAQILKVGGLDVFMRQESTQSQCQGN